MFVVCLFVCLFACLCCLFVLFVCVVCFPVLIHEHLRWLGQTMRHSCPLYAEENHHNKGSQHHLGTRMHKDSSPTTQLKQSLFLICNFRIVVIPLLTPCVPLGLQPPVLHFALFELLDFLGRLWGVPLCDCCHGLLEKNHGRSPWRSMSHTQNPVLTG